MRKFRKIAAGVAAITAAAVGMPASAQTTPVDVTLENPAGSRVLYVEDMTGGNLASSGLAFGRNRSMPFRVRVADSAFNRQSFSVSATMTNLYLDQNGALSYSNVIPSSAVELDRQAGVNAFDVKALVQPLVDTVTTVTDPLLCATLGVTVVNGGCSLTTTGVVGKVQELTVPVNTSDLGNLPLLPQANEVGAFTNAEYGTGTAGADDPAKAGKPTPTPRTLITGAPVADTVVLDGLNSTLDGIGTTVASRTDLVSDDAVLAALQQKYAALSGVLTSVLTGLLATTTATAQDLVPAQILSQTGTYVSLPKLDVAVPSTAAPGDYRGTLVVTALQ